MRCVHHYDLHHGYYFLFNIFFGGRGKKNPQPPILPLMQTSATDTAAGGVGMIMWGEGRGLAYLLKISRRCAQGMLVHSFELSAGSKHHRGHGGHREHREQAGDCVCHYFDLRHDYYFFFNIFPSGRGKEYPIAHPSPHANQCNRHGSGWC